MEQYQQLDYMTCGFCHGTMFLRKHESGFTGHECRWCINAVKKELRAAGLKWEECPKCKPEMYGKEAFMERTTILNNRLCGTFMCIWCYKNIFYFGIPKPYNYAPPMDGRFDPAQYKKNY